MPDPDDRSRIYKVLFLCTGNSARSIMAEAIMNREQSGKFAAFSAGSHPKGAVDPHVLRLLQNLEFDTSPLRSKSWDEFVEPGTLPFDFIFTVCDNAAGEVCPLWPGQPMTVHWGIPDPVAATGSGAEIALAFKEAYRMLHRRITAFAALPIDNIDRLSLQRRLREIGQMESPNLKRSMK